MAALAFSSAAGPMHEMNTTPLIDVLLVLLIMLIMAVPVSSHSLDVDLPGPPPTPVAVPPPDPVRNVLVLTRDDRLLWNGRAIDEAQLVRALQAVEATDPEPEVQFEPEAEAGYEASTRVLRIVKATRITKFGFAGNERYRTFEK